jgi:hypothetical protein
MVPGGRSELPFEPIEAKIRRPVHRDGLITRTRLLDALAATPGPGLADPAHRAGRVWEDERPEPVGGSRFPGVRLGDGR